MKSVDISIVIVSFNTKELLENCLQSLSAINKEAKFEVIISDNGSTDGSIEYIKQYSKKSPFDLKLIENNANIGFAKGNNVAKKFARGEYILFLNPDTIVHNGALSVSLDYLNKNPKVGAMTCRVELKNGTLDLDTRRRFPTPLIALSHFSYLDRLFPKSIFDRYWYKEVSDNQMQEVEALQGAFFFTRKSVLDKVHWFDEDYFLDGEDIDLSFKIHEAGYVLMYNPQTNITHIKKGSKSKNKSLRSVTGGVDAMKLFYRKRLWKQYPLFVNLFVLFGINCMRALRVLKFYLS